MGAKLNREAIIPIVRTSSGLLRVLGVGFGAAVGIGGMVGSGIFRSPGLVAGHAGSLWFAALLILACGVQSLLSANLWAEVAAAVPLSGGTVVVIRRAFGDTAALIIGWTDALANVAGTAQAAAACAGFLAILAPVLSPHPGATAAALLLLFAAINWRGVVIGERTQILVTAAQGAVILTLIAVLFWLARQPAPASAPAASGVFVAGGALIAYQLIYAAFAGWSLPAYFSEEMHDPGRTLPRALGGSIVGFTALFLIMLIALAHALPFAALAGAAFPAGVALGSGLGATGELVLAAIAFATVLSCMNAGIMPGTRVLFALSRAGYAPRALDQVNRGGTPDLALGAFIALCAGLALTGRYETIFVLMGTLGLATTAAMDLAFFRLRRREPALHRPYRALGYPVLPLLAVLLDFAMLVSVAAVDLRGAGYALALIMVGAIVARLRERGRTRAQALAAGQG